MPKTRNMLQMVEQINPRVKDCTGRLVPKFVNANGKPSGKLIQQIDMRKEIAAPQQKPQYFFMELLASE